MPGPGRRGPTCMSLTSRDLRDGRRAPLSPAFNRHGKRAHSYSLPPREGSTLCDRHAAWSASRTAGLPSARTSQRMRKSATRRFCRFTLRWVLQRYAASWSESTGVNKRRAGGTRRAATNRLRAPRRDGLSWTADPFPRPPARTSYLREGSKPHGRDAARLRFTRARCGLPHARGLLGDPLY